MERNTSLEMIAVCGTDGSLQPLRFRFTDGGGEVRLGKVLEILSCKEVKYIHVEAYVYTCRVQMDGAEQTLQVRYVIRAHQWFLFHRAF